MDQSKHWILNKLLLQPLARPSGSLAAGWVLRRQLQSLLETVGRIGIQAKREAQKIAEDDDKDVEIADYATALWRVLVGSADILEDESSEEDSEEAPLIDSRTRLTAKGIVRQSVTYPTEFGSSSSSPHGRSPVDERILAVGIGAQILPDKGGPYNELETEENYGPRDMAREGLDEVQSQLDEVAEAGHEACSTLPARISPTYALAISCTRPLQPALVPTSRPPSTTMISLTADVAMTRELPPEVIEDVLGYLRHDKASLLACAEVNTVFLGASRIHLFHSVTLDVAQDPAKLRKFACWLDSAPYTARFIRELDVGRAAMYCEADHVQVSLNELFTLLDKLPVLHTLRISDVFWKPNHRDGSITTYSSVKNLEYCFSYHRNCRDTTFAFDLLRSFPSVDTFFVSGGSFPQSSVHLSSIPRLPQLRELTLDFMHSTDLLQTSLQPSTVQLQSLCVATGPLKDVLQSVAFASNIPTLTQLLIRLGLHDYTLDDPELFLAELNRFPCQALHTLTLRVPDFAPAISRHALGILANIVAPNLSAVTILTPSMSSSLRTMDWSGWESALTRFPRLRTVSFLHPEDGYRNFGLFFLYDSEEIIRDKLPDLSARGLLCFEAREMGNA
ncbi:hypothetical protein NM688_g1833 [Phlebia brevispora]|uniref:Uncharacterized protein n=1 Tax=Phlebia brevispora TaxID=194682 RepID=A0ACC1TAZ5_9APHY|nr:hypothetical protein NM688_g1833 [Phlebia brevispora]